MADLIITERSNIVAIADAVRTKGGTTEQMSLNQIVGGIGNIQAEPVLQDKTVTPTKSSQTVKADSGYDGLGTVTVDKISDNYIVPNGQITITENGTHDVTNYASAEVNVASSGGSASELQVVTGTVSGSFPLIVSGLSFRPKYVCISNVSGVSGSGTTSYFLSAIIDDVSDKFISLRVYKSSSSLKNYNIGMGSSTLTSEVTDDGFAIYSTDSRMIGNYEWYAFG